MLLNIDADRFQLKTVPSCKRLAQKEAPDRVQDQIWPQGVDKLDESLMANLFVNETSVYSVG